MTATSIGVSNLLLYISMICWLWFLLVLWTCRSSCQQHDWNHTLISFLSTIVYLPVSWSLYLTILAKSDLNLTVFNHFYLQLSICLFCDLYILLFLRNLISISQSLITSIYNCLSVCLVISISHYSREIWLQSRIFTNCLAFEEPHLSCIQPAAQRA